jgi:Kef-type K+ transport system membrane component KefB
MAADPTILLLYEVGLLIVVSALATALFKRVRLPGLIGVALSVLVGFGVGLALGWSSLAAFLLGAVIAPSGTSVVAAFLSAEGKTGSDEGSTLLTAAVIDDVEAS